MVACYKCGNRNNGASLRSRCADCECGDNKFNECEAEKLRVAYYELKSSALLVMKNYRMTRATLQKGIDVAEAVIEGKSLND